MNRILAAAIIAILVASSCAANLFTTSRFISTTLSELEQTHDLALSGDVSAAAAKSKHLCEQWQDRSKILSMYIPHSRLEAVGESLYSLTPLVSGDNPEVFESEYQRACFLTKNVLESEVPTLCNLF